MVTLKLRFAFLLLGASISTAYAGTKPAHTLDELEHAFAAGGPSAAAVAYEGATTAAGLGKLDSAYAWLDRAMKAGFDNVELLDHDAALQAVRGDKRFPALRAQMVIAHSPCASSPAARQFDYWIGEWDVQDAAGNLIGHSSIQLTDGGCLILENWSDTVGHMGKSMNFYDKDLGAWQQVWVSDKGNVLRLSGGLVNDAMQIVGKANVAGGKVRLDKISYLKLPGGKVRQLWEISLDDGKTWTPSFDGVYVPRRS